tara:strand:- start:911 stop:1675 length:765 start_codon:yes stop_codon:yes gene_type:complete
MRLRDKVAVVTGGASGIGRAICKLFSSEGARVVIADINSEGGLETSDLIEANGGNALFVKTDVSQENQVKNLVNAAVDTFGGVDVLVNDAAAFVFGEIQDVTADDWTKVLGVNVIGTAHTVKNCLPSMKERGGGSIVNIASISSLVAQPAFVPYNTSKGALLQLTRCLAMDLAKYSIRVNCICPGAIHTPATEKHIEFVKADRNEFLNEAAEASFLKRLGTPDEIAYGALFLASEESSFVTGTPLVIDGGYTAQ